MSGWCASTKRAGCQQKNGLRALTGEERGYLIRMIDMERNLLCARGVPLGGSEKYVVEKAICDKQAVLLRGTCGQDGFAGTYSLGIGCLAKKGRGWILVFTTLQCISAGDLWMVIRICPMF